MSSQQREEQYTHQGIFAFRFNKDFLGRRVGEWISSSDNYHQVIAKHFREWVDFAADEKTINYVVVHWDAMPARLQLYLQRLRNDPDFMRHQRYPLSTGFFDSDEFYGRSSPVQRPQTPPPLEG